MEDKDEDSGSWKLGMGIVAAGLIVIMSVGATSAGYYGEKLNEKNSQMSVRGGCLAHTNVTGTVLTYSDSAFSDLCNLDFSCEAADKRG